jgi:hypothetical protein
VQVRELDSWAQFGHAIRELCDSYDRGKVSELGTRNEVLFRGHSNGAWPLVTTLERATVTEFDVIRYVELAARCAPKLESLSGLRWGLPEWPELRETIRQSMSEMGFRIPCYEYLIYLRHHGFPSPLLDWTTSPYVAAYFAYSQRTTADTVAVYALIETPKGVKSWSVGGPVISTVGPYVRTDGRHFAQKARYTYCTRWDAEAERHFYDCHHLAMDSSGEEQDVLVKFVLPSSERLMALRELGDYNIDHFTLFQSEDALVATLALDEFELEQA